MVVRGCPPTNVVIDASVSSPGRLIKGRSQLAQVGNPPMRRWRSSTWRWPVTVGGLLVVAGLLWVVLVLAPGDRDEQEQDEYCETVLEK